MTAAAPQGVPIGIPSVRGLFPVIFSGISLKALISPLSEWHQFMHSQRHEGHISYNASQVVFGSWDNYVYCVDDDGNLLWKFLTDNAIEYATPCLDHSTTVFVTSLDHYLYVLEEDGTLRFKILLDDAPHYSPAVDVATGDIYASSTSSLRKLRYDGTLLWQYAQSNLSTHISLTPSQIYIGAYNNKLIAISKDDGSLAYEFVTEGYIINSSPAVKGDDVFIGDWDFYLYCIQNGSFKWRFEANGRIYASPSLSDTEIFFGDALGFFFSLAYDGTENWHIDLPDIIFATASISSLSSSEPYLYVGCEDKRLYCIQNGEIIFSYEVGDIIDSSPATDKSQNVFFGSHDHYLYCILQENGSLRWKFLAGSTIASSPSLFASSLL